jgi:hypothetical protein
MDRKSLWMVTLTSASLFFVSPLPNARMLLGQSTAEKTQSTTEDSNSKKSKDDVSKIRTTTRETAAKNPERTAKAASKDTEKSAKKTGSAKKDLSNKTAAKKTDKKSDEKKD